MHLLLSDQLQQQHTSCSKCLSKPARAVPAHDWPPRQACLAAHLPCASRQQIAAPAPPALSTAAGLAGSSPRERARFLSAERLSPFPCVLQAQKHKLRLPSAAVLAMPPLLQIARIASRAQPSAGFARLQTRPVVRQGPTVAHAGALEARTAQLFCRRWRTKCSPCAERRPSLAASGNTQLLAEWDASRNSKELGLTPADVTTGSGKQVFWRCLEGCPTCGKRHNWRAPVQHRALQTG